MNWPSIDLRSLLADDKRCASCAEDGIEVTLEPDTVYDPSQRVYVSAWVCPECDRSVYRDAGDGVAFIEP